MPRKGENIRQRSDKRWEARYITGRDENGKAIYRSVYGRTYNEVKQKRLKAQSESLTAKERPAAPDSSTYEPVFGSVCEEWLADKRISNIKISTYNRYYSICTKYLMPEFSDMKCSDITYEMANNYMNDIVMISDSTLNTLIMIFNSVMKLAADRHGIKAVKLKYRKCGHKDVTVPSKYEVQRLIRSMLSADTSKQDISKLGIIICLFTGIRIGELCALRWSDIDIDNEYIKVEKTIQRIQNTAGNKNAPSIPSSGLGRRSTGATYLSVSSAKTDSSGRIVPLPHLLVGILKEVRKGRNADSYFLSGTSCPIEPRTMQYRFKRYLKESGIKDYNFHVLRHAFATRCVELGLDITTLSKVLGHSSVAVTLSKYVHPTLEMKKVLINNLNF